MLCAILAAVVLICCCVVYPAANADEERMPEGYEGILRLWHIDSFEGGKGSRASFLRSAAKDFSERTGVFVLITVHTEESAAAALEKGDMPDMISCGGIPFAADIAKPLAGHEFTPARAGNKTYAYPWCRGSYFLFAAAGESLSEANAQNTVLSDKGVAAAFLSGLPEGDYTTLQPLAAYTSFVGGKYRYLVGSQRDFWRLTSRQFAFDAIPLNGFCDLWQYMFVCAEDPAYAFCIDFLDYLLSEEVQKDLTRIGMLSADFSIYTPSDGLISLAQGEGAERSVSAFMSSAGRAEFSECAALALKGDKSGAKKLENFLV